jgi:hypothetical protein
MILIKGLPEDSAYNNWYHSRKEERNFVEKSENDINNQIKRIKN